MLPKHRWKRYKSYNNPWWLFSLIKDKKINYNSHIPKRHNDVQYTFKSTNIHNLVFFSPQQKTKIPIHTFIWNHWLDIEWKRRINLSQFMFLSSSGDFGNNLQDHIQNHRGAKIANTAMFYALFVCPLCRFKFKHDSINYQIFGLRNNQVFALTSYKTYTNWRAQISQRQKKGNWISSPHGSVLDITWLEKSMHINIRSTNLIFCKTSQAAFFLVNFKNKCTILSIPAHLRIPKQVTSAFAFNARVVSCSNKYSDNPYSDCPFLLDRSLTFCLKVILKKLASSLWFLVTVQGYCQLHPK